MVRNTLSTVSERWSLRIRMTMWCVLLLAIAGGLIVVAAYLIVRHQVGPVRAILTDRTGSAGFIPQRRVDHEAWRRVIAQLALVFGVVATLTAIAASLMTRRLLRPLDWILAATARVSETDLSQRIALHGPPDELKALADRLDLMLARVEESVLSQRRFIADASHELRTPLAVMRAGIEVGLNDPAASEEERAAATEALIESIDRSDGLIKSMLALARSDVVLGEEVDIDLAGVAGEMLAEVTGRIEVAGIRLDTKLDPAVIRGDSALVRTLVLNLLRNAVEYNRPRGRVELATRTRDSHVELLVSNTGDVVLEEEVPLLFEPFRRSRASRSSGAGLGLAIVRSVAERHGGEVVAQARLGGGLEIKVVFPSAGKSQPQRQPDEKPPRRRLLRVPFGLFILGCVLIALGYGVFFSATAVAHLFVARASDAAARRGATAFPLVWQGMSEQNVRRVAGQPSWAGQAPYCAVHLSNGTSLSAPCESGTRCLMYGDVDSKAVTEFCFEGGLRLKRRLPDDTWRSLMNAAVAG